jgi:predicted transcriptional regulator
MRVSPFDEPARTHERSHPSFMVTMNISLDDHLAKRIEALAKKSGKSVEEFIADAAKEHVEYTESLVADVQNGLAEADAGQLSSIDR